MIRNLKALGLALVAIFAMSALSASAASATDFFTTSNKGPAWLTGVSHDNKFETATGTKFECTTSSFAATVKHASSEATVDVTYAGKINQTPHNNDGTVETECTATGGEVTIDMEGCHYILTGNTTGEDPPVVGKDATVWITCPAGKVIKITQLGTGVTITVGPQTPTIGGVVYTNLPAHSGGAAVKVTATVTGVAYTCHGFACHFGPGTSGTAKYTGTATVTGWEDKNLAGEPFTPAKEGNRIGVSVS